MTNDDRVKEFNVGEALEFSITDFCNLECQNCSQATPIQDDKLQMSLEQLKRYAALIKPDEFKIIKISGGEPTLHKEFREISLSLDELFPNRRFHLATNGVLLHQYLDVLGVYERIEVSYYPGENQPYYAQLEPLLEGRKNIFPSIKINSDAELTENVKNIWKNEISISSMNLVNIYPNKNKSHLYEFCNYRFWRKVVQDRIYSCCISFGLSEFHDSDRSSFSVPFDEFWRERLYEIDMNLEVNACMSCYIDVPFLPDTGSKDYLPLIKVGKSGRRGTGIVEILPNKGYVIHDVCTHILLGQSYSLRWEMDCDPLNEAIDKPYLMLMEVLLDGLKVAGRYFDSGDFANHEFNLSFSTHSVGDQLAGTCEVRLWSDGQVSGSLKYLKLEHISSEIMENSTHIDLLPLLILGTAGKWRNKAIQSIKNDEGYVVYGPYIKLVQADYDLLLEIELSQPFDDLRKLSLELEVVANEKELSKKIISLEKIKNTVTLSFSVSNMETDSSMELRVRSIGPNEIIIKKAELQRISQKQPKLTIFSAPKAFIGHIGLIQRNAVESWLNLGDLVEVILLGNDAGVKEIAEEFGLLHIPNLETNAFGTPLLNSLIGLAEEYATAPYLCMINADIVLTHDLLRFLNVVEDLPRGLYVGLRSDLDLFESINFGNPNWEIELTEKVRKEGRFRGGKDDRFNGTDYYIFPKGLYSKVPPFAIGRFFWDSWLLADIRRKKQVVIDITSQLLVVHQNHNYNHVKSGKVVDMYRFWMNPELKENFRLMGGFLDLMGPREATHSLTPLGVLNTPKSLLKIRMYNFWYYYPIILRSSSLFQSDRMSRLWADMFPFDEKMGRHKLRLGGIKNYFLNRSNIGGWRFRGDLIKMRDKVFGISNAISRLDSMLSSYLNNQSLGESSDGKVFFKSKMVQLRNKVFGISKIINKMESILSTISSHKIFIDEEDPVLNNPAYLWIVKNIHTPRRLIVPAEFCSHLDHAFGYGIFQARSRWRMSDLDFDWIVLSRNELWAIPTPVLRLCMSHMNLRYRNEEMLVLSVYSGEKETSGPEWGELGERLAKSERCISEDMTVILNVWKRGPALLRRQIDGLLRQSVQPKEIWVCAFGVSNPEVYENIVKEFYDKSINFIGSTINLKYHGRFQVALLADSEFVAFIDDDIIIGRDFLSRCVETIRMVPDAGDVGVYGWAQLPKPDQNNVVPHYTLGESMEHLPCDRKDLGLVPVDCLWGFHFLRTRHVRLLFRDDHWTNTTGEDFQLAYSLKKYAGLRSYMVPVDPLNMDTWALSSDWKKLQEGRTTVGDMDSIRDSLYWKLLNKGMSVAWMKESSFMDTPRILAVFRSPVEATKMREIADKVIEDRGPRYQIGVFLGSGDDLFTSSVEAFGCDPKDQSIHRLSCLNMDMGWVLGNSEKERKQLDELLYACCSVIECYAPSEIIASGDMVHLLHIALKMNSLNKTIEIIESNALGAFSDGL